LANIVAQVLRRHYK